MLIQMLYAVHEVTIAECIRQNALCNGDFMDRIKHLNQHCAGLLVEFPLVGVRIPPDDARQTARSASRTPGSVPTSSSSRSHRGLKDPDVCQATLEST